MPKPDPTPNEISEAIYRLSLSQMRILSIMQAAFENIREQIPDDTRAMIDRYLNESFEDNDKINSQFGEFDW